MTNLEKMSALIEDDLEVRAELSRRCAGLEGTEEEAAIMVELAVRNGIPLTREELGEVKLVDPRDMTEEELKGYGLTEAQELDDDELELVVGGDSCEVGKKYNCDTDLWEDSFQSQRKSQHIKGKYVIMRISTNKLAKAPILLGPKLGWIVRGGCDCV